MTEAAQQRQAQLARFPSELDWTELHRRCIICLYWIRRMELSEDPDECRLFLEQLETALEGYSRFPVRQMILEGRVDFHAIKEKFIALGL